MNLLDFLPKWVPEPQIQSSPIEGVHCFGWDEGDNSLSISLSDDTTICEYVARINGYDVTGQCEVHPENPVVQLLRRLYSWTA